MSNIIKQQLWTVSLGMVSAYGPEKDLELTDKYNKLWKDISKDTFKLPAEILQGIPKTSSQMVLNNYIKEITSFLEKVFYISNREDLLAAMNGFLKGSKPRLVFDSKRHFLLSLSEKERTDFLKSIKNRKDEFWKYFIINQYNKSMPPAGILACDMANYTCMCRFGLFLGYLSENELLDHLQKSAVIAQKNYSSFEEFGLSATVGHLFHLGDMNEDIYYTYLTRLERALLHTNCYWSKLDWNLDL